MNLDPLELDRSPAGIPYWSQRQINENELSSLNERLTSPVTFFCAFFPERLLCWGTSEFLGTVGSWQESLEISSTVVKSGFYQLSLMVKVKPDLLQTISKKVIQSFIAMCPDYCESLEMGSDQPCLDWSQLVQDAAVRLLTETWKCERTASVEASLASCLLCCVYLRF